jgi:FADH2 O2-dependent halogenase
VVLSAERPKEADRVVIIGGGPGGSTLGWYLSRAGIPNTIVERAVHPRHHVGESMVSSTVRIFDEMGFLPVMEREGFVRKYGASWHPPRRRADLSIEFREFPQEGVNQEYTYHVDRSRFDHLLLRHAEEAGSEVLQGTRVKEVDLGEGRATGVWIDDGRDVTRIPCAFVADASGRDTVLGRQLGWKINDPTFNQFAVHGWFEGVERGDRPDDIHIYFLPVERGWVWQIPITETVTSVGVVAERDVFRRANKDHARWFDEMIRTAPDIEVAMANARLSNDLIVEADYSYSMESLVGNGFLLLGDAARFVDPIFSSGVSVAMHSAKFAAEVIVPAIRTGDVSAEALRPYEERLRKGTTVWYEFIKLYYKLLPLFTHFIASEDYRHQVLQLLQGDVYDRDEVPVLDAMRKYIEAVEENDRHLLAPALDRSIEV